MTGRSASASRALMMERAAHEGAAHDGPLVHQSAELVRVEALDARPQADVRRLGDLALHPDEVLDHVQRRPALAAEQELPVRSVRLRVRRSSVSGMPRGYRCEVATDDIDYPCGIEYHSAPAGAAPLIGLLRTYLRPYQRPLAMVLVLLLIGTIGNLYLPDLNADIIDNGIAKGDTELHPAGSAALMLVVTALARRRLDRSRSTVGARVAMGFGRDVRTAIFAQGRDVLAGRGQPLRRRRRSSPATPTTSSRSRPSCSWA